jgi:hypothetical protein
MATNINTIFEWFNVGKKPTQQQFWNSWKSFWHKDEIIPQAKIENLTGDLDLKTANQDFLAHLSDAQAHSDIFKAIEQESYKVIDSYVSGGVYNISTDDFGTTIRYNGTAPVTVTLSTATLFALGKQFKIYQAGTGQVTFSVSGYMLRYGSDVIPRLYGAYSTAIVEITDVSPATAYIHGKLELA